jgi:mannose-6-phosphate isomerase-like protein (cupin superfamily)
VTTAWHQLFGISERYLIVSGRGRVPIGHADAVDVGAGDVVRIPPDTPQRIENSGDGDLINESTF